ncbi:GntR family transcriptional regulator [Devosia sp. YIM 151766]|uniref:GntR family transcriptional regulator n=1 Tax=Devosia sp. YIM 151766 TaxID=3017325 RepID=UPI00255C9791|nr:GntR family transcriptional regulator [Devosia sp. YIM 151766]WIY53173.1 GntR family transcriptional regulator [Devosia sp. YIM 151766]
MKPATEIGTLADRAFEWLEESIIKGVYAPGERLDEVSLSKAFGISRGPVREAIRRLEGKRLVERVARSGVRVAQRTLEDLVELLTVREALEGMACRLATERISDEALDELDALLDGHSADVTAIPEAGYFQRPGDYDFHFRIIQACGNRLLTQMLCEDMYHLLRVYRFHSSKRTGRAVEALNEHRRILDAMRKRDPALAEKEIRRHLARAREAVANQATAPVPPRLKPV